ncbi:MAG: transporter family protein [Herbinix sp.]|nr:transporter family protein [Herbinix sp.]
MSIVVKNLTKAFTESIGIFNINFEIKKGEVFGYLGPNGAGKTTTIRHLLGFMHPDSGSATINGFDCWKQRTDIQNHLGYLPGEINFVEGMTGIELLNLIGDMRSIKDFRLRDQLIDRFDINTKAKIKRMSKGMKQKIGIVTAFMHDPDILILDEPSSGLDPLMQNEFIKLILEEKSRGKTILMSSHIFEEVSRTCDRISIIKEGRLVITDKTMNIEQSQDRLFNIIVKSSEDIVFLKKTGLEITDEHGLTVTIRVKQDLKTLFSALSQCEVVNFTNSNQGLEETFMNFYTKEAN